MYRVTTPTHTFTLPLDTSTLKEIQVSYKQGNLKLIKHYQDGILPDGMTISANTVIVRLSQEETKKFNAKDTATVQVRVLTNDDDVFASQKFVISVVEVISEDILS